MTTNQNQHGVPLPHPTDEKGLQTPQTPAKGEHQTHTLTHDMKGVERTDTPNDGVIQNHPAEASDAPQTDADTFPREYVEQLRREAAESRQKAKRADDYARQLFTARVAATGRLADPNDLPFNTDLVDDLPALEAAIDDLLAQHPHYAARTPRGDIGQGVGAVRHDDIDLAAILRRGA